MHSPLIPSRLLVAATLAASSLPAVAQQATVTAPYRSANDSFYESTNLRWGMHGPGWFFRFGDVPATPYGNFDPNAGAAFGFGFRHSGTSGHFFGNMAQGSRQNLVTWSPGLTLINGFPGYLSDSSWSPFVMGMIPVVSDWPNAGAEPPPAAPLPAVPAKHPAAADVTPSAATTTPAPSPSEGARLRERLAAACESSAGQPAVSVEEARRLREAEQSEKEQEANVYVSRGKQAEAAGQPNLARQYYLMAYRRATGTQKDEIRTRLAALMASKPEKKETEKEKK